MNKKRSARSFSSIKRKAIPVLKKHDVKRAAIFGSFARGDANSKSDVDFLIEYKGRNKSLLDLVGLKLDLEETLARKVDIPWKKIAGMRDVLIHEYFDVDLVLTWKVVKHDLPLIKKSLLEILSSETFMY